MHAFYTDEFVLPLPESHRFPMQKYRILRDKVANQYNEINLLKPSPATREQLLLAHSPVYIDQVFRGKLTPSQQKEIGFPWSLHMVERAIRSVGATVDGALSLIQVAPQHKAAVNLAGGTHHANHHNGSGFCVFNDTVVASRVLQQRMPQVKVLIIDLWMSTKEMAPQLSRKATRLSLRFPFTGTTITHLLNKTVTWIFP